MWLWAYDIGEFASCAMSHDGRKREHAKRKQNQTAWFGYGQQHSVERPGAIDGIVSRFKGDEVCDVIESVSGQIAALISFNPRQAGEICLAVRNKDEPVVGGQQIVKVQVTGRPFKVAIACKVHVDGARYAAREVERHVHVFKRTL